MQAKIPDLARAFTGMRFEACHAARAVGCLRAIDRLKEEIALLQDQARAHVAAVAAAWGTDADGTTGPGARRGQDAAVLPAVQRLAEVLGVSEDLATGLIAELGLDMSRFPTPAHLVSWAGMAPVADQSGPRGDAGRKAAATPTPAATLPRPATAPRAPPPSSASGTAAFAPAPAAEAGRKPAAPSAAPSSSSCGTC